MLAQRAPARQLNVDATRVSQAFVGSADIQVIIAGEVNDFVRRYRGNLTAPVELTVRNSFNPNLKRSWFGSIVEIINQVTLLSILS